MENLTKTTKRLILLSLVIIIFLVVGCSNQNTPKSTVNKIFSSAKKFDIEGIEKLIKVSKNTTIENSDEDLEKYINVLKDTEGYKELLLNVKELQDNLEHKIFVIIDNKDHATVKVNAEYVDASSLVIEAMISSSGSLFKYSMSNILSSVISGNEIDEFDEAEFKNIAGIVIESLNNIINKHEIKTIKKDFDIELTKDDSGKWFILDGEINEDLFNSISLNLNSLIPNKEKDTKIKEEKYMDDLEIYLDEWANIIDSIFEESQETESLWIEKLESEMLKAKNLADKSKNMNVPSRFELSYGVYMEAVYAFESIYTKFPEALNTKNNQLYEEVINDISIGIKKVDKCLLILEEEIHKE